MGFRWLGIIRGRNRYGPDGGFAPARRILSIRRQNQYVRLHRKQCKRASASRTEHVRQQPWLFAVGLGVLSKSFSPNCLFSVVALDCSGRWPSFQTRTASSAPQGSDLNEPKAVESETWRKSGYGSSLFRAPSSPTKVFGLGKRNPARIPQRHATLHWRDLPGRPH